MNWRFSKSIKIILYSDRPYVQRCMYGFFLTIGKYGGDYGYNIVNFIMMYVIGAYIRRFDVKCKSSILVVVLLAVISAITGWAYLDNISGFEAERNAWEYCNPLVIFEAVVVFLLFKNIRNLQSNFINLIARNCFFVYLLHIFFLRYLRINEFVVGNPLILIAHILFSTISVFSYTLNIKDTQFLPLSPLYIADTFSPPHIITDCSVK